jgi:HlyD family secretion protein
MSRKSKIWLGIGAAVVALIAISKIAGGRGSGEVEVRLEPVARRNLVSAVTASGNIEAKSQVDVQSEVTARIMRITVQEGDLVQKGQLLVELDQVQFLGAVERASAMVTSQQASLMQARTNRDQALRTLERTKALKASGTGLVADEVVEQAQQAFDVAEANLRASEAALSQAEASLKEARDNLARTRLYAPISGRVVRLAVEEGEVAVPGTFSRDVGLLMRIADLSVIQAKVKVDETDVIRLELGDSVEVKIDAYGSDTAFVGRVTKIANSAAAISAAGQGTDRAVDFEVEVTLENPPADVRPDLSMTARIITDVRENVLSIPIIALTARPDTVGSDTAQAMPLGGSTSNANNRRKDIEGVFVVENGIARFRPVKIGIAGDEHFELLSGLNEGDTIVAGSYQAIRDMADSTRVRAAATPGTGAKK